MSFHKKDFHSQRVLEYLDYISNCKHSLVKGNFRPHHYSFDAVVALH